jgi:2-(3-amino-3-carboxypropyl)histidine synthase
VKEEVGVEEVEMLKEWVRNLSPRRVLIQAPPGLIDVAREVSSLLVGMGVEVVFSGGMCWGGCDLALREAAELGCDAIVHIGHAEFVRSHSIPVFYLEHRYQNYEPVASLLPEILKALQDYRRVALGATVQYLDLLERLAEDLRRAGHVVLIGEPSNHLRHRGQVLGCDYSTMTALERDVDAHLVLGSVFHGLGLALISEKEVFAADPHSQKVVPLREMAERVLRKRYAQILAFRTSRKVGVVVSVKPGQMYMGLARWLTGLLKGRGYEAELVVVDEVRPEDLEGRYEALVNTACPRLSVEDQERFRVPVLLPGEVLVALDVVRWDELLRRGLLSSYPQSWVMAALTERPQP